MESFRALPGQEVTTPDRHMIGGSRGCERYRFRETVAAERFNGTVELHLERRRDLTAHPRGNPPLEGGVQHPHREGGLPLRRRPEGAEADGVAGAGDGWGVDGAAGDEFAGEPTNLRPRFVGARSSTARAAPAQRRPNGGASRFDWLREDRIGGNSPRCGP